MAFADGLSRHHDDLHWGVITRGRSIRGALRVKLGHDQSAVAPGEGETAKSVTRCFIVTAPRITLTPIRPPPRCWFARQAMKAYLVLDLSVNDFAGFKKYI